jgi:proton glutamate symport protein
MSETRQQSNLHWWIIGGMLFGAIWGTVLHETYYADFYTAATTDTQGQTVDGGALTKSVLVNIDAQFQETTLGGLAYGLAALFMNLLKMVVLPLVFTSLVSGIVGLGDFKRLGTIGGRTALWYLTTTLLAIVTGLLLVNLINPGVGVTLDVPFSQEKPAELTGWGVLIGMVPTNVVDAAAKGKLLPLIFFAICFGVFLLKTETEAGLRVREFFQGFFDVMMKLTGFIITLAPIGIAALIAKLLATTGPDVFESLAGYAMTVAAALAIHFFLILPGLLYLRTKRNPYAIMRQMSPALLTAFSTASSSSTLPVTLDCIENRVGVSNRISGFVLPLGATVNMDGTALYECVATLFVAQVFATSNPEFILTFSSQMTIVGLALLVSIGAAGIPHAGLVMMTIIFAAVGLPFEMTALLWAVDRPLDMCRTATNVWSDTLATVYVAHTEGEISEVASGGPDV